MIVVPYSRARRSAISDFPAAVGPQMTGTLSPAKAPVELVPRQLHYRRPAMDVMCRQRRVAKRCEQRSQLRHRQLLARLYRRFARDCCSEMLVAGGRTCNAISGERVQRFPKAALGVKARMRHRHAVHNQRIPSEALNLEAKSLQVLTIRLECVSLG